MVLGGWFLGLVLGFFLSGCSLFIGIVAIGVLLLVFLWRVLGTKMILFGLVGLDVVVTGGAVSILCSAVLSLAKISVISIDETSLDGFISS